MAAKLRRSYATRKSKTLYIHVKEHIRRLHPVYVRSHIRFQGKNKVPVLVRGYVRYLCIIRVKSYCRRVTVKENTQKKKLIVKKEVD